MTPWTIAHQAPVSMGFPQQEYWSGLPFPSPEALPDPGIKPMSPALAGFCTAEPPGSPRETVGCVYLTFTPLLFEFSHQDLVRCRQTVRVLPPIKALPVWWGLSWCQTRKMTSLDSSTLFKHLWACIQRFLRSLSVFILLLHIIVLMQCNLEASNTMAVCVAAKKRYFFL